MRRIFADSLYWVAMIHSRDQWHQAAMDAAAGLAGCRLVTTDDVLNEVLASICKAGPVLRRAASALVHDLHADPAITVHPQSRPGFLAGLALFEARPDKQYSLTDCISMATMRYEGITEVLTHDQHFFQEGFVLLL